VYLWDVIAGQSFYETRVHEGLPVTDVDIATTQPLVATVGGDGRVTVWNVEKHTGTILEGHQGPTTAVAFTKDDTYIVSAGVDHTIRLWNYVERVDVKTLAAHVSRINDIDVRARDDVVVTASTDGTAKLWDIRRGELLATIATTSDGRWVATAPDGRVTGSDGDDGGVSLVYWQAGDIQLPGFVGWQRWSAPGLVRGILAEEADD
jgi:WD40 repeat protein